MANTIEAAFNEFHRNLMPSPGESEKAKSHRESIRRCLSNNFGLDQFFRIGSYGHGTSIRDHSDVDYLAIIPYGSLPANSKDALTKVRNVLDDRFPRTGVRVNTPAVRVPFGTKNSEAHEVVPATSHSVVDNFKWYEIADGNGYWVQTSPDKHNQYVTQVHLRLDKKVKPLIRFIKAWKYYNDVPVLSFYLELFVAKYAQAENTILYDVDIRRIFYRILESQLSDLYDPLGVSGIIQPCNTDSQRDKTLSKLKSAHDRAEKACQTTDVQMKFYWWGKVFNGMFSAFG